MKEFKPESFIDFFQKLKLNIVYSGKKKAYNIPCAFDIEDSSFYYKKKKYACMYEWTFGIGDDIFYGRTWKEFSDLIDIINKYTDPTVMLLIYVHNLSHEFQFNKGLFEWEKVLALSDRNPIAVRMKNSSIEFRCSYLLTGKKLEKLANENLFKHNIKKLVGQLDYSLIRTPETKLTSNELAYCENDVRILLYFIDEQIEIEDNNILKIPYTKTGYVRRYIKQKCFKLNPMKKQYMFYMQVLSMSLLHYRLAKLLFQGGFTHASCVNANTPLKLVDSYDEKSAYPSMIRFEFPCTLPMEITLNSVEEIKAYAKNYCMILYLEFHGLRDKVIYEHYITYSKCLHKSPDDHVVLDNGRVVSADRIEIVVTELDFDLICDFYEWDELIIKRSWYMRKSYLPKPIIESFLEFFERKTKLDGVEGQEQNYALSKNMLNSAYGMMVTDPMRMSFEVDHGEWKPVVKDINEALTEYNESRSRFVYYFWGIWITAYNRHVLLKTFLPIINNGDHVYSDTDSGKILHVENYVDYFENVNKRIDQEMLTMCEKVGIDPERTHPKKPDGDIAWLGHFEHEGQYELFKTIGAKRYMYLQKGELNITISGVAKKQGSKYLKELYKNDYEKIFEAFDDDLEFPAGSTGKLTHTYIDEPFTIDIKDYQGHKATIHEESYVHLEEAPYKLSLDKQFLDFLKGIKEIAPIN